jgi:hypothetical protein
MHDRRIKAAVVADPLSVFFTAEGLAGITIPVQLWGSEKGGDGVEPHDRFLTGKKGLVAILVKRDAEERSLPAEGQTGRKIRPASCCQGHGYRWHTVRE